MSEAQKTRLFQAIKPPTRGGEVLREVYRALEKKGYDPVQQIVGYLLSGDPTYITREARGLLRTVDRDELMEELVRSYLGDV